MNKLDIGDFRRWIKANNGLKFHTPEFAEGDYIKVIGKKIIKSEYDQYRVNTVDESGNIWPLYIDEYEVLQRYKDDSDFYKQLETL